MATRIERTKKEDVLQALERIKSMVETYSEDEIEEFHCSMTRGMMDVDHDHTMFTKRKPDSSLTFDFILKLQKKSITAE
jgi:hypothetical protein